MYINYKEVGKRIAKRRNGLGLKQAEANEMAELSRSYLSSIEAPNKIKTISLEVLFNIAKVLNVEPSKLLEFR